MLTKDDFEILDNRYRKIDECEEIKGEYTAKLTALSVDIAVIKTKLTFMQWLGGVVGAATIGIAVKYLFGG